MTGFLTFVVLLGLAGLFVLIGFGVANDRLATDRMKLEQQRQALDAEWTALDQTRRVRAVFLGARRAMQREAQATWAQEKP